VNRASQFGCGANHIIEVLTGADTEKIRRWGHDRVTTYGIGGELSRPQWAGVFRELLRLGYVMQSEGQYPTVELTENGVKVLRERTPITLTKAMVVPRAAKVRRRREGEIACDEILFERLRQLRKKIADERSVPAYVVFGDATLRQMAREYPETPDSMHDIFGMGAKKHAEFAETFAEAVRAHLAEHGRQTFNDA
jgi:ATP-dependent DNA helicase RecQ